MEPRCAASLPRFVPALLSVLLLGCLPGNAAESESQPGLSVPALTRAQLEADLEHLTVRLKRAWAYAEDKRAFLGVDLDALRTAAQRQLGEVRDADGFYRVVEQYVAGMMDGHASVKSAHPSSAAAAQTRWPFKLLRLNGRFYIKTFEGDCASLQIGDEILSVNGVPVAARFRETIARTIGSTTAGREYRALTAMRRETAKQLRVTAARADGAEFSCQMPAVRWNSSRSENEESISWKKLDGNIGYLRLPSFAQDMKVWEAGGRTPSALQAALESKKTTLRQAFSELASVRALILDLRGNGGGSDALGHFLAHLLCDTAAHPDYYSLSTQVSEDLVALPEFASYKNAPAEALDRRMPVKLLPAAGVARYRGKLAVLMDEGCFSACDCFLNYLSVAAPDTLFVGRPNGAGAGAPRPLITLPHSKLVVTFCVMQVWNLNNQLIESRPLKPTIPVLWTAQDLRERRDPDLQAAIQRLNLRRP